MATIVRPYNDWREQALVNFLGPIVGDWIQNARQAEQNRKQNALAAQTLQDLGLTGQGVSLGQPQMPEGYNSDGWQRAFHQGGTPLDQYDMGTASVTPQQTVYPNQADVVSAFMRNLGDKRFGMLNPQTAMQNFTPYLQANEAARIEQRRNQTADKLRNAGSASEMLREATGGLVNGDITRDVAELIRSYNNPYSVDTGGQISRGTFDYTTGQYVDQPGLPKTLSPQQLADNAYRDAQLAETQRQFRDTMEYNREGRAQQQSQFEAEHNLNERKFQSEDDFRKWQIQQQEEALRRGQQPGGVNKDLIDQLNKDYDRLDAQEKELRDAMLNETDQTTKSKYNEQIQAIRAQKQAIQSKIYSLYSPPAPARSNTPTVQSIGSRMLGNAGSISRNGEFGNDRGDHTHKGTDYKAPEGEPIRLQDFYGGSLKVTRVNTNPKASSYGNYVVLEGKVGGQNVSFLMAHMKTGSVAVKVGDTVRPGDIIGQVGSTGRSTGPHMHLEIRLNGQLIDPEKYYETITPYVTSTKTSQGTQATQQSNGNSSNFNVLPKANPNSGTKTSNQEDTSLVVWTHPNDPKGITQQQYEYMVSQAEAGKVEGLHSREEVDNWLISQGHSKVRQPSYIPDFQSSNSIMPPPLYGMQNQPPSVYQDSGENSTDTQASQTQQSNIVSVNVPDTFYYDPQRDKDIQQDNILTKEQFENQISDLMTNPNNSNYSPEQIARHLFSFGIRVRRDDAQPQPPNPDIREETPNNDTQFMPPPLANDTSFSTGTPNLADEASALPEPPSVQTDIPNSNIQLLPPPLSEERSSNTIALPTAADLGYTPQEPPSDISDENVNQYMRDNMPETDNPNMEYELTAARRGARRRTKTRAPVRRTQKVTRTRAKPRALTSYQQTKDAVDGSANRHGVEPELIRAIIQVESTWDKNATSNVGAMGLMQLMPATARSLGVTNAYDPAQNIEGGTKYVAQLLRRYKGNVRKAVTAYNAGPTAVDKGRIPKRSQAYAQKVLNIYNKLKLRRI